jgi:hypothetical protein
LYVYKSELPAPLPAQPTPLEGIGGWLILVAIHHVIRPIGFVTVLVTLFPTIFHVEAWRLLTQPGHSEFHPYWAPALLFELLYNAFCLIFSLLLVVLFFMKRAVWPRWYPAFFIIIILGTCLDTFLAQQIPAARGTVADNTKALLQVAVAGAIWIPYCFVSKRVKATFRY